ncbi:MAG TPA: UDP-N-acetylmuramate dehydrogenase [Planctomycetaceae bacterium]|nr:UDP-N-acetylmuramate dehydrogenase [Planctomycetaceae bacterium]
MSSLDDFAEITRRDEPLAPHTWLKVGGPAQYFIEPRDEGELKRLLACCHEREISIRVLGGGSNLLVRDEGVGGVVVRLAGEAFSKIDVKGTTVRAGSAAPLSNLISHTVKAKLAGLEVLAGIPGTIGGALRGNAGGRSGDIGQFATAVRVLTVRGEEFVRTGDALTFGYRTSSINEPAVLEGTFELQPDDPEEIIRRMRKLWIMKKATQPLSFQSAGCIFKNPRGLSAGALIEQAGLKGTRIGGAEVSDRHANFIVTHEGVTADDVLRLIDLARSKVAEQFGVDLELEIQIW